MARPRGTEVLRHSVIDRLTVHRARGGDLAIGVAELRNAIRRDLEWLLNSRRLLDQELEDFEESRRSILSYGLPDLSPYSQSGEETQESVCGLIRKAIRHFEPRIAPDSIRVEYVESQAIDDFTMTFRVFGTIDVDPIREPISFDLQMDPGNGTVDVEADDHA